MHVLRSHLWLAVCGLTFVPFAAQPARAAQSEAHRTGQTAPAIYVGKQQINTPAFIEQRQLFVPVRGVFEAIGASVTFAPPRFVVVRKDGAVIAAFMLDRKHAIVGHQAIDIDAAPTRRDGRVYVPLRVVAQAAGATVAYTSAPPAVHIRQRDPMLPDTATATADPPAEPPSMGRWRLGVAVVTGLCCLGCLVLTARRFALTLFGTGPKFAAASPAFGTTFQAIARGPEPLPDPPPQPDELPPDRVAVTGVEMTGEARLRKEVVNEMRTIEVSVTREELVIEYAGEGGVVLVHGRELASGETVRIPLWEERVQVDVTKYQLVDHDIVVAKRRFPKGAPQNDGPADFGVAEGSPS